MRDARPRIWEWAGVEIIDRIADWVAGKEAVFSGLAALVALAAIVPAALRPLQSLWRRRRRRRPASSEAPAPAPPALGRTDVPPRLAVLPIEVVGDDDDLRTASEIMTAELTALLARSPGSEVISRRSATSFAEAGGTTTDAGRTLGVRYVVEGQLSRGESGLRIGATLVDTARDGVVWSDGFETSDENLAAVARSLAERVATHLGIELTRAEVGRVWRQPESREARDLYLLAQGVLLHEGNSRESYARAIDLLSRAIAREPDFAEAHGSLALLVALGNIFGFFESESEARERSLEACRRAIEIDDRSSDVLGYVGCAYCDLSQYDRGLPLLERAIELNPSNAQAKAARGTALIGLGRFEEGVTTLENALRLAPAYKGIAPWATVLASGYLHLGRTEEAASSIDKALGCDPGFFPAHLVAAMLALARSDPKAATRHLREAKRLNPDLDPDTIRRIGGREAMAAAIPLLEAEEARA
jgi:TolB-like protein/Tfp pilus assembly protein PilF